ncbi:hypothetical protein EV379_1227 [Microterricola gilva]|uniref:Uncharacterized protein n=1 Tax=Microterricola gilva TaxID=393267 RepID=A0A4V2GAN0_9MICO|nr:hypothetical protein [Microterricola gilva]RZU64916.1 hypothetical protein EV379_1227 [Microterricola gilva]
MKNDNEKLIEKAFDALCKQQPLSSITRSDIQVWLELFESCGAHLSAQEAARFKPRPFTDEEMNHPAMTAVFAQEAATEVEPTPELPGFDGTHAALDALGIRGQAQL